MRVLVVGGAGFLGSVVVHQLCQAGRDVTVCDNLGTGNAWAVPPEARFVPTDITDPASLDLVLRGGYDAVVHLAGVSRAGASRREPLRYLGINLSGSLGLLASMKDHDVGRLVYASSAAVYGDPGRFPVTETASVAPASPYAFSIAAVEQAIVYETLASDLAAVTLRLFNLAGAHGSLGEWHHPETHLVPAALHVAAGVRASLSLHGADFDTPDGTAVRDFVHVTDAARACLLALEATTVPGHRLYNIGSGTGHSVGTVLRAARVVTGARIPAVVVGRRHGQVPVLVASTDRARCELGWVPQQPELEGMIGDAWAFLRSHLGCGADLGSVVIA